MQGKPANAAYDWCLDAAQLRSAAPADAPPHGNAPIINNRITISSQSQVSLWKVGKDELKSRPKKEKFLAAGSQLLLRLLLRFRHVFFIFLACGKTSFSLSFSFSSWMPRQQLPFDGFLVVFVAKGRQAGSSWRGLVTLPARSVVVTHLPHLPHFHFHYHFHSISLLPARLWSYYVELCLVGVLGSAFSLELPRERRGIGGKCEKWRIGLEVKRSGAPRPVRKSNIEPRPGFRGK